MPYCLAETQLLYHQHKFTSHLSNRSHIGSQLALYCECLWMLTTNEPWYACAHVACTLTLKNTHERPHAHTRTKCSLDRWPQREIYLIMDTGKQHATTGCSSNCTRKKLHEKLLKRCHETYLKVLYCPQNKVWPNHLESSIRSLTHIYHWYGLSQDV